MRGERFSEEDIVFEANQGSQDTYEEVDDFLQEIIERKKKLPMNEFDVKFEQLGETEMKIIKLRRVSEKISELIQKLSKDEELAERIFSKWQILDESGALTGLPKDIFDSVKGMVNFTKVDNKILSKVLAEENLKYKRGIQDLENLIELRSEN